MVVWIRPYLIKNIAASSAHMYRYFLSSLIGASNQLPHSSILELLILAWSTNISTSKRHSKLGKVGINPKYKAKDSPWSYW